MDKPWRIMTLIERKQDLRKLTAKNYALVREVTAQPKL